MFLRSTLLPNFYPDNQHFSCNTLNINFLIRVEWSDSFVRSQLIWIYSVFKGINLGSALQGLILFSDSLLLAQTSDSSNGRLCPRGRCNQLYFKIHASKDIMVELITNYHFVFPNYGAQKLPVVWKTWFIRNLTLQILWSSKRGHSGAR